MITTAGLSSGNDYVTGIQAKAYEMATHNYIQNYFSLTPYLLKATKKKSASVFSGSEQIAPSSQI